MTGLKSLFAAASLLLAISANAADLKGIGMFETLDKPWFATALYVQDKYGEQQTEQDASQGSDSASAIPERLEFKVVEDKISQRRFRQLWLDVLAVVQDQRLLQNGDMDEFLGAVKGSLKQNDHLVLKQEDDYVSLTINYHEHARLSRDFLASLVDVLIARIAPIPELKHGLMGTLPRDELRGIQRAFDKGEPSLHRISQTSRWLRIKDVEVSQRLASSEPSV